MSGWLSAFCATEGGSRSGGVLVPLGTAVPWGDSPRVQGGPWAPPPCGDKSSETLLVWYLDLVRFLWDGCWVFCAVFFCLWGWIVVWFRRPKGPDPCLPRCLVVPSLFFVLGLFVGDVFLSSFSFSGAGETQTPFGVWVSPSVSSSWTRTSSSTRSSSPSHSPRPRPAPAFFFLFFFSPLA